MHAAGQSGGRSVKPLNGPSTTQQLKSGSDSVQNSGTSLSSQATKGKKREKGGDQGTEPTKRQRFSNKPEDAESASFSLDNIKFEVAKITEKGALFSTGGCEKLIHFMQLNRNEKKLDLAVRILLVNVIADTEKIECLSRFVQLKGVPILDEWLQEAHKGKTGDGSSPKESDKGTEDLLLALLRALDKLPVNLNALRTCNIGKSVNYLRNHKNLEIQKKSRNLVDTWKKRVDAEMTKVNDGKSSGPTNQDVMWPGKIGFSDIPHSGSKLTMKALISQPSACNKFIVNNKPGHVDAIVKSTPASPGDLKLLSSSPLPSSVAVTSKNSQGKGGASSNGNYSELPHATVKVEKSSSSSQSQNNSQSYSGDHAKSIGSSWKEDARSSTAGSLSASKTSGSSSRRRRSNNGFVSTSLTGVQKVSKLGKVVKVSNQPGLSSESTRDIPGMHHGNEHRMVVRIRNPGRSPTRSTSGGSLEDPSVTESGQSNDVKEGIVGSDEGNGSPGLDEETGKAMDSSSGIVEGVSSFVESKLRHSLNVLIESCAKYSEPCAPLSCGDDIGMNLLASVAAGEMSSKTDLVSVSPSASPKSPTKVEKEEPSATNNEVRSGLMCQPSVAQCRGQSDENADSDSAKPLLASEKLNVERKIEENCVGMKAEGLVNDLSNQSAMHENKPIDRTHEKIAEGTSNSSELPGNSLDDKCKNDVPSSRRKPENFVFKNSFSSTPLMNDEQPAFKENHAEVAERICGSGSTSPSTSNKFPCLETDNMSKIQRSAESEDNHLNPSESAQKELTASAYTSDNVQDGSTNNRVDKVLERKEAFDNHLVSPVQEAEKCSNPDLDRRQEVTSSKQDICRAKLDFDLNEGFSVEDANQSQAELTVSSTAPVCLPLINLPTLSPFASCPTPNGTPAPITVAAPSKGPFKPPENLLKTKGDSFGWKGSATTSAFRPAEPRKVLEMLPLNICDAHSSDTAATKQNRTPLDIDLNMADDRIHEDVASSQSSPHTTGSETGVVSKQVAEIRSAGGLDLDLNKVDEATDTGQFLGSTVGRKPSSGGLHNREANLLRDFDLNDGPGVDELIGAEPLPKSQHVKNSNYSLPFLPPIVGLRMGSNAEMGNTSSWFPHSNSYPSVAMPSFLPDRGGQHPYPIVAGQGAHRIFGSVTGSITGDIYRGPVLSSSPAMAFSPATPFPYAGFPFGSSFPLPSSSYSGGPTTYLDSSQLMSPGNAISSHYVRPYVLSLSEGSMNSGSESNPKWGGRGLDLNAGPGSADIVDVKDDRLPLVSRQFPLASSQIFGEDQAGMYQLSAGGGAKRKEREGGGSWDERFYKQPSRQ